MPRGSTQILIRKIIESLSEGTKSITDIADDTDFDRTAITKYLKILVETKIVDEESEGTKKLFTLKPTYRTDTFFGLPLTEEQYKKFSSVYYLIKKFWKSTTDKTLFKTHAQKILYKVNKECGLNLPVGWYLYGGIGVMSYNDSEDYKYFSLPQEKKIENCVKEVTVEYSKKEHAWEIKQEQYKEAEKELYYIKEDLLSILYSSKFIEHPKNSLYVLVKKLRRLIKEAPDENRSDYNEILESYQDLMLDVGQLDEDTINSKKREIIFLFESIWKYIAIFNFKHDLLNGEFYTEKVLNSHFKLDILQQEDEIIELGTELQALVPEEEPIEPLRKKLNQALSQIKVLSTEERKKKEKEMKKLKEKLGDKGYQDYLLKQVALK